MQIPRGGIWISPGRSRGVGPGSLRADPAGWDLDPAGWDLGLVGDVQATPDGTIKGITVNYYNKLRVEFYGMVPSGGTPYGGITGGGFK